MVWWPRGLQARRLRRQGLRHVGGQLEKRGLGRGLGEYLAHRCPFPAQQMNESRNFPSHLPLAGTPPQLQVEAAEGSGGGGPGWREALERGYVARAHKRRVGKRREKSLSPHPTLPACWGVGGIGCCCEPLKVVVRRVSPTWERAWGRDLTQEPRWWVRAAPRGVVSTGSYCPAGLRG